MRARHNGPYDERVAGPREEIFELDDHRDDIWPTRLAQEVLLQNSRLEKRK